MAWGEAPGSVERAWVLEAEDLSSRPDSALTGQATLAKWLSQLLQLQNGDNKAAIYFIGLLWGCDACGNCASTMQMIITVSLFLSTLSEPV